MSAITTAEPEPPEQADRSSVLEMDARGMWCPEARVLYADEDGSGAAFNRRVSQGGSELTWSKLTLCLGSDCMAWRFIDDGMTGYCGKAGRP